MPALTPAKIETVRHVVAEAFGPGASIWLFGSRAAGKEGGDVDLFVETPDAVADCLPKRLAARRRLEALLEEKVDLIVRDGSDSPQAIDAIAKETGVRL
ncbi:MAG: nucleotidyltransferase domain-containing protein [Rhodospirillales bacterium]|jgi:predicted nucleotidyltransferase|nr:nucleotidyltransferase domain-containing protein [Rhodospirillales bacterium]